MDTSILQLPAAPAGKVDAPAMRKQGAATANAASPFTSFLKQTLSSPEHSGSPAEQPAEGELIAQGVVNNLLIALTAVPALVPLMPTDDAADGALVAAPVAAAAPPEGALPLLTEAQQQNPGETSLAVAGEVSPLPVAGSSSPTTAASQAPVAVDRRNQVDASLPDAKQPTAGPDVLPAVNLQSKLDGVIAIATPSSVAAMPQPAPLPLTVNQPPIPETNAETLTGTAPADSEQMPPATVTLKEFVPVKQLQMSADDQDKPAETAEPITDAVMPPQSAANSPNREAKEFRPDNDPFAVHGLADAPRASAKLAETVFAVADAAPQPDPDQYGIIRQIVDRARLYLRPGNQSEMVLQLRPEHLGELTVKVSVTSGLVNAAFHSDNPEVRQVIEAALPQLKQDLTQQGIKLDNVGVFSGSEQFFDNGQRSAQQQPPIPLRRNRRQLLQAVEAVETAAVTATDGVDYRI